jgi:hypothetical protein
MIKWTKLPYPDCLTQDPNLIYVVPCEGGSQIWYNGLFCFAKNITVQEFIDNIKTTSSISIEEIEKMIEELNKES